MWLQERFCLVPLVVVCVYVFFLFQIFSVCVYVCVCMLCVCRTSTMYNNLYTVECTSLSFIFPMVFGCWLLFLCDCGNLTRVVSAIYHTVHMCQRHRHIYTYVDIYDLRCVCIIVCYFALYLSFFHPLYRSPYLCCFSTQCKIISSYNSTQKLYCIVIL